jgi:hypothetical protein
MRLFVCVRRFAPELTAVVAMLIVAMTGAGAGATWLIVLGLGAVVMLLDLGLRQGASWRPRRRP